MICGLACGFAGLARWWFWLRGDGVGNGRPDELGGAALLGAGFGEHWDRGGGVSEGDVVAGEGGEVCEQATEAAQRGAVGVCWREALAWAAAERWAGATGLSRGAGFSSVKVSGAHAVRRCQVR